MLCKNAFYVIVKATVNVYCGITREPQRLKPRAYASLNGTTEVVPFQKPRACQKRFLGIVTAAVKVYCGITSEPQRLKPRASASFNGTTEVVPFQSTCKLEFFLACKGGPSQPQRNF